MTIRFILLFFCIATSVSWGGGGSLLNQLPPSSHKQSIQELSSHGRLFTLQHEPNILMNYDPSTLPLPIRWQMLVLYGHHCGFQKALGAWLPPAMQIYSNYFLKQPTSFLQDQNFQPQLIRLVTGSNVDRSISTNNPKGCQLSDRIQHGGLFLFQAIQWGNIESELAALGYNAPDIQSTAYGQTVPTLFSKLFNSINKPLDLITKPAQFCCVGEKSRQLFEKHKTIILKQIEQHTHTTLPLWLAVLNNQPDALAELFTTQGLLQYRFPPAYNADFVDQSTVSDEAQNIIISMENNCLNEIEKIKKQSPELNWPVEILTQAIENNKTNRWRLASRYYTCLAILAFFEDTATAERPISESDEPLQQILNNLHINNDSPTSPGNTSPAQMPQLLAVPGNNETQSLVMFLLANSLKTGQSDLNQELCRGISHEAISAYETIQNAIGACHDPQAELLTRYAVINRWLQQNTTHSLTPPIQFLCSQWLSEQPPGRRQQLSDLYQQLPAPPAERAGAQIQEPLLDAPALKWLRPYQAHAQPHSSSQAESRQPGADASSTTLDLNALLNYVRSLQLRINKPNEANNNDYQGIHADINTIKKNSREIQKKMQSDFLQEPDLIQQLDPLLINLAAFLRLQQNSNRQTDPVTFLVEFLRVGLFGCVDMSIHRALQSDETTLADFCVKPQHRTAMVKLLGKVYFDLTHDALQTAPPSSSLSQQRRALSTQEQSLLFLMLYKFASCLEFGDLTQAPACVKSPFPRPPEDLIVEYVTDFMQAHCVKDLDDLPQSNIFRTIVRKEDGKTCGRLYSDATWAYQQGLLSTDRNENKVILGQWGQLLQINSNFKPGTESFIAWAVHLCKIQTQTRFLALGEQSPEKQQRMKRFFSALQIAVTLAFWNHCFPRKAHFKGETKMTLSWAIMVFNFINETIYQPVDFHQSTNQKNELLARTMSTLPNLSQVLPNLPQNKEITMMNIMEKSENITDINQTILKVIHYATHHVTDWNHLEQLFKRLQLSPSEQLQ